LAYILGRIADVPDFGAGRPSPLIHMNGPRGPAPLEPTAGVSLAAVRIGTGLGRPGPTHRWAKQP
jgi:hypothetical protein